MTYVSNIRPPQTVTLTVPLIAKASLLLPERPGTEGHRGLWFYDPALYGDIHVGDAVEFLCCEEIVARGTVAALVNPSEGSAQFQDYCSRVNGKAFRWVDKEQE